MVRPQSLAVVAATAALVSGQTMNPPAGFEQICRGRQNIIEWKDVPHDWNYEFNKGNNDCCRYTNGGKIPVIPNCCDGDNSPNGKRYQHKDWWYFGTDWEQRIANGEMESQPASNGNGACNNAALLLGNPITFCSEDDADCPRDDEGNVWSAYEQCRKACAFEYTTEGDIREKCNYFSYDEDERTCLLFSNCGWPLTTDAMSGIDTSNMKTDRIVNIYPAGFKSFDLREFSEPPVCIWVPGSGNKKVEVMIEPEMNDASVCIRDGRDMGVGRNMDVGNIETCNMGKLEACFTAATDNGSNNDFFFMIYCDGSCEASDLDLWLRIRTSNIDWNAGKTSTADDIEMWCEMEKGSTSLYEINGQSFERDDYTWPSDLLPKKPSRDPFNIKHTAWSAAGQASVSLVSVLVAAVTALALH